MNIENSIPITALETPGGSPMKDSSDTHPNHLPDSSYGLFIDNQ
ncbi:aldehyde dehydrogenase domain protein [Pseudomonas aeruginosa]|nr:aldehyde dehydrogenase domain protein [Pseudomonas aeruginosa]